jgi:hypothetical protein
LREVRFDDHAQVAALALKFDLDAEDYEAWVHLWAANPTYREIKGKLPMGWVLEAPDGNIAGYFGNIPLSYELDGKKLLVATGRSWVVDTAYRTYSLLLLGTYFQQANVDLFLVTSLNAHSAVPFAVFESTRVPVGAWDRTLFWITNPQGFTESFFRKKGWAGTKPLSYALSLAVSVGDQLCGSRFRRTVDEPAVTACDGFDERFDVFWQALRKTKAKLLLAVRNREVLEWHFRFPLLQKTAWICTVEDGRGLAAYSVFLRQDRRQTGLRRMCLADFQCLEQEKAPTLLTAMLRAAFDRCQRESVQMLEVIGLPPRLQAAVERASPHRRQLANWMYFYKTKDRALREKLGRADVWEPSLFDGDSSL